MPEPTTFTPRPAQQARLRRLARDVTERVLKGASEGYGNARAEVLKPKCVSVAWLNPTESPGPPRLLDRLICEAINEDWTAIDHLVDMTPSFSRRTCKPYREPAKRVLLDVLAGVVAQAQEDGQWNQVSNITSTLCSAFPGDKEVLDKARLALLNALERAVAQAYKDGRWDFVLVIASTLNSISINDEEVLNKTKIAFLEALRATFLGIHDDYYWAVVCLFASDMHSVFPHKNEVLYPALLILTEVLEEAQKNESWGLVSDIASALCFTFPDNIEVLDKAGSALLVALEEAQKNESWGLVSDIASALCFIFPDNIEVLDMAGSVLLDTLPRVIAEARADGEWESVSYVASNVSSAFPGNMQVRSALRYWLYMSLAQAQEGDWYRIPSNTLPSIAVPLWEQQIVVVRRRFDKLWESQTWIVLRDQAKVVWDRQRLLSLMNGSEQKKLIGQFATLSLAKKRELLERGVEVESRTP